MTWKSTRPVEGLDKLSSYLRLRYFVNDGLFQGEPEEYFEFERPGGEIEERSRCDGISALLKYDIDVPDNNIIRHLKVAGLYTTGYQDIFSNNTFQLEATFTLWGIPIMMWTSKGHNSDLVDYYENVTSYGIALEVTSND